MKRTILLLLAGIFSLPIFSQSAPKREFRGAWIHVIGQSQYQNMSSREMKQYFINLLDNLQAMHVNAVIFQVRPSADAFYYSEIEPWSQYLTGTQGKAPEDNFDPMAFLLEETHKRMMEFHAWLNPYRVTASDNDVLCNTHLYYQHPERFVKYGKQLLFDPGLPENRNHICKVVKDIVSRYDVDAIHMDDYFYPYPIAGEKFPDENSFRRYAPQQGFRADQIDDWRRNNVNLLIEQIKRTIVLTKPWVRFGISPFGIYRNKKNTPDGLGSNTNGLQNYDDLYADILLWMRKGWIDYCVPQIYWEIGHSAADYETLIRWWSKQQSKSQLYIGQDVERTMKFSDLQFPERNQLPRKMQLERTLPGIDGNCWWSGYSLIRNGNGIADSLRNHYQAYPALIPAYTHLHKKTPKDVKSLKAEWTPNGYLLHWQRNGDPENPEKAQYYVIYRFKDGEKTQLNDPSKIVAVTKKTSFLLPYEKGTMKYKYVVTSADRFHNETKKGKSKKVKL
ncbi:MAG: family 10 glycosylhydrolase [Candidatus Azobacteroides sp.]|nr:family 10 glycosylhydrolase [Candidatus Azobacteroides sp.]